MASHSTLTGSTATLDLSRWRKVPFVAIGVGAVFLIIGALVASKSEVGLARQFGFSWLTAFMFFLSIAMGGLFLTFAHHLFDASWSVPIRRTTEHLACLSLPLFFLFIPVAVLAPKLYAWMSMT